MNKPSLWVLFWVLVKQEILSRELGLVTETNMSKMEKELETIDRRTKERGKKTETETQKKAEIETEIETK